MQDLNGLPATSTFVLQARRNPQIRDHAMKPHAGIETWIHGQFTRRMALAGIAATALAAAVSIQGAQAAGSVQPAYDNVLTNAFPCEVVNIGLERLGYTVQPMLGLDVPAMHIAVGSGDVDFTAAHFKPIQESAYTAAGGDGAMVRLGGLVAGLRSGYLIDKRTADEHKITGIEQFKDPQIAKLFSWDGSGKADLSGVPPGWGAERVIEFQLDEFKLRDSITHHQGQYEALMADAAARFHEGKPVLLWGWMPHAILGELVPGKDVVWLGVPYSANPDGVDTKEADGSNTGFGVNDQLIIANKSWLEKNPSAKRFFELVAVPVNDASAANFQIQNGEKTPEAIRKLAEDWVAGHQAEFDKWIEEARKAGQ